MDRVPVLRPRRAGVGRTTTRGAAGVDVRLLLPGMADHWMFKYLHHSYVPEVDQVGVKVYRYDEGFMHQKVFVVDEDYASVGTANLDNRSFRLNFEVTCLVEDRSFCREVSTMLERDFAHSTLVTTAALADRSLASRFATKVTRLLAPTL